jgi:hypothetical protein
MGISINDFSHNLKSLFGDNPKLELLKVADWREFTENSRDKGAKLGYKYQVVSREYVVKFNVKVAQDKPVITSEELEKTPAPVLVSFGDSKVSFYGESLYNCDLSVTAESIKIAVKPTTEAKKGGDAQS